MVGRATRNSSVRTSRLRVEPLEPRLVLTAPIGLDGGLWPDHTTKDVEKIEFLGTALGDAGEVPETAFDAGRLDGPQSYRGWVGWWDRRDVVRFELSDQSRVEVALRDLTADLDLLLYDGRGNRIAAANRAGARSESIGTTLDPGTFFLVVSPYRWSASPYALSLDADVIRQPPAEPPPAAVRPDGPASRFPDVPYFGGANEWNVNAVNAPEAWAQDFTGQDVTVAVVDTGIDLFHADLVDNLWVNTDEIVGNGIDDDRNGFIDDVQGWDFADGDNIPWDGNGHGTHVAGTIAAGLNGFGATGVAPDATLLPVRVLGNNGSGSSLGVAAGIRYAADNGADIINLSLGGGYSPSIRSAIGYAGQRGSLVVAAAGNEAAAMPTYPARFSSQLSHVVSVGAYAPSGAVAGFSNDVGPSGAVQVDAPGVGVYSTFPDNRYARLSGTSMAAPHVSGLAALALSATPSLSAAQLRSVIAAGAAARVVGSDARGAVNAATTVAQASSMKAGSEPVAAMAARGGEIGRSYLQGVRSAAATDVVRQPAPQVTAGKPTPVFPENDVVDQRPVDGLRRPPVRSEQAPADVAGTDIVLSRETFSPHGAVRDELPSDMHVAATSAAFQQDPGEWLAVPRAEVSRPLLD